MSTAEVCGITEMEIHTGRSYSVTMYLVNKGKFQDSALLHREDEESCYKQTVSQNNETSLWLKSECICEYVHNKASDTFPFMIHISDAASYAS